MNHPLNVILNHLLSSSNRRKKLEKKTNCLCSMHLPLYIVRLSVWHRALVVQVLVGSNRKPIFFVYKVCITNTHTLAGTHFKCNKPKIQRIMLIRSSLLPFWWFISLQRCDTQFIPFYFWLLTFRSLRRLFIVCHAHTSNTLWGMMLFRLLHIHSMFEHKHYPCQCCDVEKSPKWIEN